MSKTHTCTYTDAYSYRALISFMQLQTAGTDEMGSFGTREASTLH